MACGLRHRTHTTGDGPALYRDSGPPPAKPFMGNVTGFGLGQDRGRALGLGNQRLIPVNLARGRHSALITRNFRAASCHWRELDGLINGLSEPLPTSG